MLCTCTECRNKNNTLYNSVKFRFSFAVQAVNENNTAVYSHTVTMKILKLFGRKVSDYQHANTIKMMESPYIIKHQQTDTLTWAPHVHADDRRS